MTIMMHHFTKHSLTVLVVRLLLVPAVLVFQGCGSDVEVGHVLGHVQQPIALETEQALIDALALYERTRAERFLIATEPIERFETMIIPGGVSYLVEEENYDQLFTLGDEAFETERDRLAGFGQGDAPVNDALPATPQRIHLGEKGGLDSSSCRSCHFVGGPDGAGTHTQIALLRGDGRHLESATARDAPHVMGLGYIAALTEYVNVNLAAQVDGYRAEAAAFETSVFGQLEFDGVDFGTAIFYPDGSVNTAGLKHISSDFKIRPFGWKGRHGDLVSLVDEALQVHHGHQSTSREAAYADTQPETYLGGGPPGDRDGDGIYNELSSSQPLLLAAYLSLLGVPEIHVPAASDLSTQWAEGQMLFESVGCQECHRSPRVLAWSSVYLEAGEPGHFGFYVDPLAVGQDPKPEMNDFLTEYGGTPFFPFTDLRRHDLGPSLAEPVGEKLPDLDEEIPGERWLTRSLWGLADTAPYLHDGRAQTVDEAIMLHGGDAELTRIAYIQLTDEERASLRVYLLSLTRAPTMLVE